MILPRLAEMELAALAESVPQDKELPPHAIGTFVIQATMLRAEIELIGLDGAGDDKRKPEKQNGRGKSRVLQQIKQAIKVMVRGFHNVKAPPDFGGGQLAVEGFHLNDLGQLAMGHAMLRGLDAPAEVSSATIDAAALRTDAADNCRITALKRLPDGIAFRRLDRGLPLNLGIFSALNHRWIPIPDTLNGYRLKITGLEPGDYEIRAEGRLLGRYPAARLARGENIASATSNGWEPGGPWDAQSDTVREIVDARDKAWGGEHFRQQFNRDNPSSAKIKRQAKAADDALIALARTTARPYPYQFEIRRAAPAKAK